MYVQVFDKLFVVLVLSNLAPFILSFVYAFYGNILRVMELTIAFRLCIYPTYIYARNICKFGVSLHPYRKTHTKLIYIEVPVDNWIKKSHLIQLLLYYIENDWISSAVCKILHKMQTRSFRAGFVNIFR